MNQTLRDILDLARWAPSGDNTQPWRFAIEADDRVVVYGHDTRATCVYDLDGHPSQISLGALLETMAADALESLGHEVGAAEPATRDEPSSTTVGQRLPE